MSNNMRAKNAPGTCLNKKITRKFKRVGPTKKHSPAAHKLNSEGLCGGCMSVGCLVVRGCGSVGRLFFVRSA